jgi:hypothetical protein
LHLVIKLLLCNCVLVKSGFVAIQVDSRFIQDGLVTRQRALSHFQLNLIGPRVDLEENLTLLDQISFVKMNFHYLAVNPGLDGNCVESTNVAEAVEIYGDAGAHDLRHYHGHWAERRPTTRTAAQASPGRVPSDILRGDRVARPPDRVSRYRSNDQKENDPNQSALLGLFGAWRC